MAVIGLSAFTGKKGIYAHKKENCLKDDPLNRLKMKRGSDLPQSKLDETKVKEIRLIVEVRERMREELKAMTNAAIAEKYGVHYRTVDRITAFENWNHVD
jgi:hypothetical protein